MAAGMLLCYTIGTAWFTVVYSASAEPVSVFTVLSWCVFPFIVPDALKIALAVFLTKKIQKHVKLFKD